MQVGTRYIVISNHFLKIETYESIGCSFRKRKSLRWLTLMYISPIMLPIHTFLYAYTYQSAIKSSRSESFMEANRN